VSTSLSNLLLGVAVAVSAFLLQELVRFVVAGVLFRRRLTADIRMMVSDFRTWAPPPEVAIQGGTDVSRPGISMALIWDYGYESMDDLYDHAAHLAPELFTRVVHFYCAAGRFDEIRCSYNVAIIETVKASDKSPWAVVLNCHLRDMAKVAGDMVKSGESLLSDLVRRYPSDSRLEELTSGGGG
jgi:hypothetical protein